MDTQDYRKVAEGLQQAKKVCVITHLRPDADAIGSATALGAILRQLGKEAIMVIGQRRGVSRNLLTIPLAGEVRLVDALPSGFDTYVTVDCGSLERTGALAEELATLTKNDAETGSPEDGSQPTPSSPRLVCIDHHSSNPGFGHLNLVDVEAESTTVVIYELLKLLEAQIGPDISHSLYAGLVTDTGSFRWGRPAMHDIAAELMRHGLDTKRIAFDLLDTTTSSDLKMLGRVLSEIRIERVGSYTLAILVGRFADLDGHPDNAVEALVEHVRAIEGTDIAVVFKEEYPTHWAVSLRSSVIDCSAVAQRLGGGGHVPAAGYSTNGTDEEIIEQLRAVLEA